MQASNMGTTPGVANVVKRAPVGAAGAAQGVYGNTASPVTRAGVRQDLQSTGALQGVRQDARQAARQQMLAAGQGVDQAALRAAAQQAQRQYVTQQTQATRQPVQQVNMPAQLTPYQMNRAATQAAMPNAAVAPMSGLQATIAANYPWLNQEQMMATAQSLRPQMGAARQGILQQLNQADPTVMQGIRQDIRQGLQGTDTLQNIRQDARQDLRQQMLAAGQAIDPVALKQAARQAAQGYVQGQARQEIRPFLNQQALQNLLPSPVVADANGAYGPVQLPQGDYYNPMAQIRAYNQGTAPISQGLANTLQYQAYRAQGIPAGNAMGWVPGSGGGIEGLRNFLSAMGYGI